MKDSLPARYSIIHNSEGFNMNMVMGVCVQSVFCAVRLIQMMELVNIFRQMFSSFSMYHMSWH